MTEALIYRPMGPADLDNVITLLADTFITEPMESLLEISFDEFAAVIGHEIEPVVEQGLSLVTEDSQSGELVGVTITHDAYPLKPYLPGPRCDKYRPISAMINPLHHEHVHTQTSGPGELLYIFISGVKPAYQGRGIVKQQVKQLMQLASDRGFSEARLISTGPASNGLYQKLGFERIAHAPFAEFDFQGERPFASLTSLGGFTVLTRNCHHPSNLSL